MIIEIENLVKEYKTYHRGHTARETIKSIFSREKKIVHALQGISFSIKKGEIIGFAGPNGAGKSTTIKILTGLLHPTSGKVKVMNQIPWKNRRKYVSKIGVVFGQKGQMTWDVPPIDSFYLNQAIYSIPEKEYNERLNSLIEMLGLSNKVNKPTRELSFGERMKCEFIMSILHNPEVLFLDEPTIGLDVIVKEKIREFIININKTQQTTIMLTTHDLQDIERLATRVIIINKGLIHFDGDIKSLRKNFGNKKFIRIKTENKLPDFNINGINIIKSISDRELNLELDLDIIPLQIFINKISNQSNRILDLTVEELPVEQIIKEYYLL